MMTRVERVGAGMLAAGAGTMQQTSAKAKTEERNIRALLLKKRVLSRGNWRRRSGTAEVEFRRPREERRKSHIKEAALKHEQERYRQKLSMHDREPDEVGEIKPEGHLCERQTRLERPILAAAPRLRPALNSVFGRAREIRLVIEDRFQNRARIIERKT